MQGHITFAPLMRELSKRNIGLKDFRDSIGMSEKQMAIMLVNGSIPTIILDRAANYLNLPIQKLVGMDYQEETYQYLADFTKHGEIEIGVEAPTVYDSFMEGNIYQRDDIKCHTIVISFEGLSNRYIRILNNGEPDNTIHTLAEAAETMKAFLNNPTFEEYNAPARDQKITMIALHTYYDDFLDMRISQVHISCTSKGSLEETNQNDEDGTNQ